MLYGRFFDGHEIPAHVWLYQFVHGPIPVGFVPDHLCQTPACVNPGHIEIVTGKENILRGNGTGARNAVKTHCAQGHEYTPENTVYSKKQRRCRICQREQWYTRKSRR